MKTDFEASFFEINPFTLALIAERSFDNEVITKIYDEDTDFIVDKSPYQIIDEACKLFGSSLKGRQEGTKDISGISHKTPISIDPSSGMYFFPTTSPKNPKCSWIAHSHIDELNKLTNHHTEIIFKNTRSIKLNISYGTILNQVQRTAQFRYLLDRRLKYLQRLQHEVVAEPSSLDFE
ncbi:competence protein ComK [Oceanobacillus halophilus]|uniref:Competence protein n=1 Tax=Oceanobacillus halophilus TaxID=930130 RepID=A0A495A0W7_9BACI|nr:competence protein ComK [Oceanobacillus halophilus]RKQ31300.1 competence protein [Oceanobacillus halophilus]